MDITQEGILQKFVIKKYLPITLLQKKRDRVAQLVYRLRTAQVKICGSVPFRFKIFSFSSKGETYCVAHPTSQTT